MTKFSRVALGAWLLMASLVGTAPAEEAPSKAEKPAVPVLYRLSYWEVDDKTLAGLAGKVKLAPNDVAGRRLQSQELLSVSGVESLLYLGRKNPIVYYDGRATQFQVQYVDTGAKMDVNWSPDSGGKGLEVYLEISRISVFTQSTAESRTANSYPNTEVFLVNARVPDVHLGDMVLLGTTSGPLTTEHVRALDKTPKAGNLLITLELEAP